MLKVPGYGRKGDAGAEGSQGTPGAGGATGAKGDTGTAGATGATGPQGTTGLTGATGAQGVAGPTGATGATGSAGSNATATPLATTAPVDLGTAAVGTSSSAARADHAHNLPTGRLVQVAAGAIGETLGLSVSLGVRRYTISAAGTLTTDRIMVALTGAPSNGTLQDAYVSAAGTVSIGLLVPSVGLGAVVSVPVAVYKVV